MRVEVYIVFNKQVLNSGIFQIYYLFLSSELFREKIDKKYFITFHNNLIKYSLTLAKHLCYKNKIQ